jgi:hypothetical protein
MRLGTTIAAVVLASSLTASTADSSGFVAPWSAVGTPTATPPTAVQPAADTSATPTAGTRPNRTARAPGPSAGDTPSWSVNLSAGQGAGVTVVDGAARLDPAGVFLAPLEDGSEADPAGTGSTGADAGPRAGAGAGGTAGGGTGTGGGPGAGAGGTGTGGSGSGGAGAGSPDPRDPEPGADGAAATGDQGTGSTQSGSGKSSDAAERGDRSGAAGSGAASSGPAGLDAAAGPRVTTIAATTNTTPPATASGPPVPTGLMTLPIQRLDSPALQVDSLVVGVVPAGSTAGVDVRGRDANGNWSEWIPAGDGAGSIDLPRPAVEVQSRLVLTGPPGPAVGGPTGPEVRGVRLTIHPLPRAAAPAAPAGPPTTSAPPTTAASPTAPLTITPSTPGSRTATSRPSTTPSSSTRTSTPPVTTRPTTTTPSPASTTRTSTSASTTTRPTTIPAPGAPLRYRVFATREGLVGRTTANGHKIKSSDRFVALPSRRALSPLGSHDYSVRVCAGNGRCATAPVWDVGPWNTRDDYWNPASTRQEWRDLPQGMPEAQAAKEKGYNGGRDQFDRKVANPAGIDLSDGLFWDALGLTDNSWVTVEYLWTGSSRV